MAKIDIKEKKCITPEFRVSFPAVFKPKAFQNQEPKYSVVMLFDKRTDLAPLKKIMRMALVEKFGEDQTKWPKVFRKPFRDGDKDKPDTAGYANTIFVTASSKQAPGLVGPSKQAILNEADFYAGCYARAELIAYYYDTAGNKGVGFALQNVQKLRDGESLSGRKNAEDVFDAVEDTSEDATSYTSDDDLGLGMGM